MNDPIIGIVKGDPKQPGIYGIVNRAIIKATSKPGAPAWATHVRLSMRRPGSQDYFTFEETIDFETGKLIPFSGVLETPGIVPADLYRTPVMEWAPGELLDLWTFCKMEQWIGRGYNILQLLADAIIFKTRPIWEKLNYVPFAHHDLSAVCSAFVGEGIAGASTRYFDKEDAAMLVPQDFVTMAGFQDTVLT